jgi:hypothetical protein
MPGFLTTRLTSVPLRISLLGLARTPEGAAGFAAGVLAVFENLNTVDENVSDADRILVGLLEGSTVGDRLRIETTTSANMPCLINPR